LVQEIKNVASSSIIWFVLTLAKAVVAVAVAFCTQQLFDDHHSLKAASCPHISAYGTSSFSLSS